jgi:two-component system, OmpR family, sensor histidine kinase KdpD
MEERSRPAVLINPSSWWMPEKNTLRTRLLAATQSIGAVVIALLAGLVIEQLLHVENVLLVFLPAVLFAALRFGLAVASGVSLLSVLASSFFLAEPRFSFAVADPDGVWALAIFLIVASFTSNLAAQARERAAAASYHSQVAEHLYAFSSRLAGVSSTEDLVAEIVRQLAQVLKAEVILIEPRQQSLRVHGADPALLAPRLEAATHACLDQRLAVGPGTGRFEDIEWQLQPLVTAQAIVGVVGVRVGNEIRSRTADEVRLLEALRDQAAVNLERTQLAEEMSRNQVLAETEKLRSALLTSISHDLRTPLASILGNVSSLRRLGHLYDDATRAEMLEFTEVETLRLARFVDNLLHMTRIDAGALQPTFEMIDLGDVLGSALKRLARTLAQHQVLVDIETDLKMVPIDFMLMEQVLANLLDNAAKYAPPGTCIRVSIRSADDCVELLVMDEGPGIPHADLHQIFERFYRVRATDHRPAGAGLGLAICRGFVEAMGGRIRVANRPDRSGALFTVTLPAVRATVMT